MFACPRCRSGLHVARPAGSLAWVCPFCEGRALLVTTLGRTTGDRIVSAASSSPPDDALACPSCLDPMSTSRIRAGEDHVQLDVCTPCTLVWFDGGEHDIVRQPLPRTPTPPPIPMRPRNRALEGLELQSVGEARAPGRRKLVTWSVITFILLLSVMAIVYGLQWIGMRRLENDTSTAFESGRRSWHAMRLLVNTSPLFLALHLLALAIGGPIVEERLERGAFAGLLVMTGIGAVLASRLIGGASDPYVVGSAPFVAATFATALVLHRRMRVAIWPAKHTMLPLWGVALAWALLTTIGILAGAMPPIWPALFVAVLMGGGAAAFMTWRGEV